MRADTQEIQRTEVQLGHQLLPVFLGQWAHCACVEKSNQKAGSITIIQAAEGATESYFM